MELGVQIKIEPNEDDSEQNGDVRFVRQMNGNRFLWTIMSTEESGRKGSMKEGPKGHFRSNGLGFVGSCASTVIDYWTLQGR